MGGHWTYLVGPELGDLESSGRRPLQGPTAFTHQFTIYILTISGHIY